MKRNRLKKLLVTLLCIALLSGMMTGCHREATQEPNLPQKVEGLSEEEKNKENPIDKEEPIEEEQEKQSEKLPEDKTESQEPPKDAEENALPQKENLTEHKETDDEPPKNEISQRDDISQEIPTKETSSDVKVPQNQNTDKTKIGWGPGGPTDENGRPDGATIYQQKYGDLGADFIREDEKKIYLTFDEGYENGYTPKILDVLKEKNVPATFFVTMPYAKSEPELIKRMIAEGHIVGNHSVSHKSFPELSEEECRREVMEVHDYVKDNFQYEMDLFRFPMGEFSTADLALLQELGYRSVFWSFAHRDWVVDDQPDPTSALQKIEEKCHPGAVYLLHAVSKTNTEILPQMIDDLRAQGYEFCAYHD